MSTEVIASNGLEVVSLRALATGSGAERWLNCSASVAMCAKLPRKSSKDAEKGTDLHKQVEEVLSGKRKNESIDPGVRICLDVIESAIGTYDDVDDIVVEKRFPLLGSSGGIDAYCITGKGKHGYIFDFKFGVRVKVQAFENEQLAFYACALKEAYPQLTQIHCYLIQPNIDGEMEDIPNISMWTLPYQTLAMWRRKFEVGLDAVEKGSSLKAGKWCQFCTARAGCPAHLAMAARAEAETRDLEIIPGQELFPDEPTAMLPVEAPSDKWPASSIADVAKIFKARARINNWFNKAEEFLLAVGQSGHEDKLKEVGFELYTKRSNRRWGLGDLMMSKNELAVILKSRGMPEVYKPPEMYGITEAEKYCNIDDLVVKPQGSIGVREIK